MKFGITDRFECSYLADQLEQLLVLVPSQNTTATPTEYDALLDAGFRRSGEQIYRPHCAACDACQSIRLPVKDFKPSKSQRRIINKNSDIQVFASFDNKPEYFSIYQQYINQRHANGSMYPALPHQYESFTSSDWLNVIYVEFFLNQELIAIAVTDELPNSLSALYTFFKPEYEHRSLGTLAIIHQLELAKKRDKQYLYLGYQVDACQKMNYKANFHPHERFIEHKWHLIKKNSR
ncbi:arginyltransferase [Aliiglaciecola sp. LCG003]|uniref:arginyltransferase n=1 Tax=Aliiglaciecola sp. LCG003 TaxID=3053655 RepID=UPI0025747DCD|nr:arginyltransferase [Aliiglaciecola sp. LCG003]WJG11289.1 arginyltransferase [Aliiglaciecola sp. LCG003]